MSSRKVKPPRPGETPEEAESRRSAWRIRQKKLRQKRKKERPQEKRERPSSAIRQICLALIQIIKESRARRRLVNKAEKALRKEFKVRRQEERQLKKQYFKDHCRGCSALLTDLNSRISTTSKSSCVQFCRPCGAKKRREWSKTPAGRTSRSRYESVRLSRRRKNHQSFLEITILATLRQLIQETRSERNIKAKKERQDQKTITSFQRAFIQKIFQPCICLDCGKEFETLYPVEMIALGIKNEKCGVSRCAICRHRRRLANHGGGPRRRCKYFDVPYETINPLMIFERDGWICSLCDKPINSKLLGDSTNPLTPEMEHTWPLSVKIGDLKSPGHVPSNVTASHRQCNSKKGEHITEDEAKLLVSKFYPGDINRQVHFDSKRGSDVETPITCENCGASIIKFRATAKYCSKRCSTRAYDKRRRTRRFRADSDQPEQPMTKGLQPIV